MTTTELNSLGWAAVDWIEHFLVHGPGDVMGQRVELDDEFAAFVVKAYRVDPRTGARLVRRAFLSRAKGRSKSGLAGFLADFEALGPCRFDHWAEFGEVSYWGYGYEPGEPVGRPLSYAEILCVATEEGQAGHTYDGIYYTLHPDTCSPALLAEFGRIDVGLTRINLPDRRGFVEPVTAANESKDGAKSTFIVADETHLWIPPVSPEARARWKLGRMHQTMARNLLKRKAASGWMLETSTMYAAGEGSVAEGTHAYAKSLRRGDRRLLFDHRQASDGHDLTKRSGRVAALRESYGPFAEHMDLRGIADMLDDPQVSESDWRRFWLNQPVPLVEPTPPAFGFGVWEDGFAERLDMPPFGGAIGVATTWDRAWTCIGASGRDGDDLWVWSSDRERNTAWIARRAKDIQERRGCKVVVAGSGPSAPLIPDLEREGVEVTTASAGEYMDACSALYDKAQEKSLRHRPDDTHLNGAVDDAQPKESGQRGWYWDRKAPGCDVAMLEAVTLAAWGADMDDESQEFFGAWR